MNRGLLDRFYKGECSREEVKAVLKWFQEREMGSGQEQDLYALWQETDQVETEEPAHDAARTFSHLKAQLQEAQQPEPGEAGTATRLVPWQQPYRWLKVAAAVLLPLCLAWAFAHYTSRSRESEAVFVSVSATPGVKKTIKLPDGSVIRLNAGSQVSFRKKFDGDRREITLRGEAFFEVAKDPLRPFIVYTGNISTQALGTSFNINYSPYDDAVTVALATGVVKVDKQEQGQKKQLTRLVPGQQLAYSKASQRYAVTPFDASEVLGWKEGVLLFRNADMDQVVRKLENWYGVDIEVEERGMPAEPWNYTGEYDNESLEKVLEGIGFVKGFTHQRIAKGGRAENKVRIVFN